MNNELLPYLTIERFLSLALFYLLTSESADNSVLSSFFSLGECSYIPAVGVNILINTREKDHQSVPPCFTVQSGAPVRRSSLRQTGSTEWRRSPRAPVSARLLRARALNAKIIYIGLLLKYF